MLLPLSTPIKMIHKLNKMNTRWHLVLISRLAHNQILSLNTTSIKMMIQILLKRLLLRHKKIESSLLALKGIKLSFNQNSTRKSN